MINRYYDFESIKRIEEFVLTGNEFKAYREIRDYLERYPDDNLGHILHAEVLLAIGKVDEALEEVELYINKPLHGRMGLTTAYTTYGNILLQLGRDQEGVKALKRAMKECEENKAKGISVARNKLINYFIKNKNYEAALEYCKGFEYSLQIKLKKAHIMNLLNKSNRALDILNTIREHELESKILKGQYNYNYGKAYYDIKDYDSAIEYLEKCTDEDTDLFYKAQTILGKIDIYKFKAGDAVKRGLRIIEDDRFSSGGYQLLAEAYLELNDFEQAHEAAEKIKYYYWKNFTLAHIYYAERKFEEAEKHICRVLMCNTDMRFEENVTLYLLCILRQGKIDNARYVMKWLDAQCLNTHDFAIVKTYFDKIDGVEHNPSEMVYGNRQVYDFSRDKAIGHIKRHHFVESCTTVFHEDNIEEMYQYAQGIINPETGIPTNYFDKHVIEYKNVGKTADEDEERINQLEVITLPDTKDILTMYPRKGTDAFLDEKDIPDNKTKRLSRIDKFNMKYGLK